MYPAILYTFFLATQDFYDSLSSTLVLKNSSTVSGENGEQLPVYGNADAVLAVTHTKLSAESDFVFQVIVVYEVLKLFNDFTRTLKVAGAADANYYFHIITIPFP